VKHTPPPRHRQLAVFILLSIPGCVASPAHALVVSPPHGVLSQEANAGLPQWDGADAR
jgi:hypothetical protein